MRLISSKTAKRRIALTFVFAFMLSNLLMLLGPSSALAAASVSAPSKGTCFQHSGTVANGALVTVYSIGTLQISALNTDIVPGQDTTADNNNTTAAMAKATGTDGSIDDANDVIGNVVTIVPPSGTNFVIVPGFQDTAANRSNALHSSNISITGAQSQDSTNDASGINLAVDVAVVTSEATGVGRAIIAIARDADTSGVATAGTETYPKSGTSGNTATLSITGLGLAIPPSGEGSLSGTLTATFAGKPDGTVGNATVNGTATAIADAIPGLNGKTFDVCTVSSAAGELEAVLDADASTQLYNKNGSSAAANLLALGQIGTLTAVHVFDTNTTTSSVTVDGSAGALLDLEPILIRGKAGTGANTRDGVFATGDLTSDIDTASEAPSAQSLDLTTTFGNSVVAPITISISDDNAAATTTLDSVSISIHGTTAGTTPTATGTSATQSSRSGFLGALRAAVFESGNTVTNATFQAGGNWGIASIAGGGVTNNGIGTQESIEADGTPNLSGFGTVGANTVAPSDGLWTNIVDLRLECSSSTNPVAGWFAILNSGTGVVSTSIATATNQRIYNSQAGSKNLVEATVNFFTQSLTNIVGTAGTNASGNPTFAAAFDGATASGSNLRDNALLYASCTNNTLTLLPINVPFDGTRDIIAVEPRVLITNVSNTFSSDVSVIAQISGNNLSGTTTLTLAKAVGVPASGQTSTLASAQGVAVSETSQLAVDCSSGGQSSVVLASITSGTVNTAVSSACTSGAIAPPPPLFTGGLGASVSGNTVLDGSPVVQGEARGILVSELSATGFSELVNQVGGGTQGTVFEIALPSGCDVIDDLDDNNTASSTSSSSTATGGNDVARVTVTATGGVTATVTGNGTGDALLTSANVLQPASGATPAKINFALSAATGTGTDAATTDAVLVRLDAQDIFCPDGTTGELEATVTAKNKISSPTVTANLGNAKLGSATSALAVGFADDVKTSTKLETSTNTNIGPTPRLVGGGASTAHSISIKENHARAIPIGGRVSSRNLDPENSLLSTVLTRAQIWIIPNHPSAFSAAPGSSDIEISDDSIVLDGAPTLVTSATVNPNAPLGTLIVGIKKGTSDPMANTTTITVKNLKLGAATSSTTDLVSVVEIFSQDAGVVVNTPGIAAGNSASTPTVFTPYVQASTKAAGQLEATAVQLGTGSTANQLLVNRAKDLKVPVIDPLAIQVSSVQGADTTKITVSSTGLTDSTDNVITVTGTAGSVDAGADVTVTTGGTATFDSVTVVADKNGAFTAKVRGDCAGASSVTVNVTPSISGTTGTAVTKTALCQGATESEDTVFADIDADDNGSTSIDEVLTYVEAQGGLAAVVSAGGAKLAGVIKAVKNALGLT